MKDVKTTLSTLWIFAMFNYLYADVMGLMDPALQRSIASGQGLAITVSEGFLFGAAILMETAIAMILLSRLLDRRLNRLLNIAVGILQTLAVAASLFAGKPVSYYVFFSVIEIACTCYIVWRAWTWKGEAAASALSGAA